MGAGERYGVRIRPPADVASDGGVGELALMIAPITGQSPEQLETGLAEGTMVVAQKLGFEEAEQLVAVFCSLGADAELVEPDPTRALLVPEGELPPEAWRAVRSRGYGRGDSEATPDPDTLPFDADRLRAALVEQGRLTGGTRPVDLKKLGIDLSLPPVVRDPLIETSGVFSTRPLDTEAVGRELLKMDAERAKAEVNELAEALGKALKDTVDEPDRATMTQPLDIRAVGASIIAASETEAPTQKLKIEDLVGPGAHHSPTRRFTAEELTGGGAPTQRLDMAELQASVPTRKFAAEEAGPGLLPPPVASTVDPDIDPFARETQPPGEDSALPTRPFSRDTDDVRQTLHGAGSVAGHLPVERHSAGMDADTTEFAAFRKGADGRFETGDMGSVQGGPLVFKLEAPTPAPTETGTVPKQVVLADLGGEPPATVRMQEGPPQTVEMPSGALPVFSDDEIQVGGAGMYRLAGAEELLGEDSGARVVAIPNPPTGQMPSYRAAPIFMGPTSVGPNLPRQQQQPGRYEGEALQAGATHSGVTAALLSLFLPGMGQVYNGQRDRGFWFAVGALLVLPWIYGVLDAFVVGGQIRSGKRGSPDPTTRGPAIRGQLYLNLAIMFGVGVGLFVLHHIQNPRLRSLSPTVVAAEVDAEVMPEAPRLDAQVRPRTPIQVKLSVKQLMRKGRQACGRGHYAECEQIMKQVIAQEPTHRDAHALLAEANSKRIRQERKEAP